MSDLFFRLGYGFLAIALLFSAGLLPRFARRFYPQIPLPGAARRGAAPVIFSLLAAACFAGYGLPALVVVAVGGAVLIAKSRLRNP